VRARRRNRNRRRNRLSRRELRAALLISALVLGVSAPSSAAGLSAAGTAPSSAARLSAVGAAPGGDAYLASWAAPELIPALPATTDEGRPLSPLTAPAFDADGDAFIVWTEPVIAPNQALAPELPVRATVRPAEGPWQPVETVSRVGLNPAVTVDARGEAIAAWEGRSGVEAAIRPVGGGWLAAQTVGTVRGEEPQVASDSGGDAIVVSPVEAHGQASTGIEAAVRPAGGMFAAPQTISRHREAALDPRIAMNSRGEAIAAWDVQAPNGCLIRVAFRSAGGTWGAPQAVPDGREYCRGRHGVAIDERGEALLVWVAMRGSAMLLRSAARDVRGHWSAQAVIGRASAVAEPPGAPQLGMDGRGDATVAWIDPAHVIGGRRAIWARSRPAGRGWGATEALGEVGYESSLSFAMNASGDASVAWEDKRGIEVTRRPAGGGWQKQTTVAGRRSAEIAFQAVPVLALGARGDAMVAWESHRTIKTALQSPLSP
jgi:hypothetical protein